MAEISCQSEIVEKVPEIIVAEQNVVMELACVAEERPKVVDDVVPETIVTEDKAVVQLDFQPVEQPA